ncbi:hypothetical protein F4780DRAFT_158568 [Xylariomycetidae sp. FL0641]|nr:hypothetical protein F4780DRAFT_158568 [Xylariomycetidae sp. FL0641]
MKGSPRENVRVTRGRREYDVRRKRVITPFRSLQPTKASRSRQPDTTRLTAGRASDRRSAFQASKVQDASPPCPLALIGGMVISKCLSTLSLGRWRRIALSHTHRVRLCSRPRASPEPMGRQRNQRASVVGGLHLSWSCEARCVCVCVCVCVRGSWSCCNTRLRYRTQYSPNVLRRSPKSKAGQESLALHSDCSCGLDVPAVLAISISGLLHFADEIWSAMFK